MFEINGIQWNIRFVPSNSNELMRSDGSVTVGVTDNNQKCIFLANSLRNGFLRKVLAHELCHCICFSYDIHMPIEQEEYLANWVSLYGTEVIYLLDDLMQRIRRVA